MSEEPNDAHDFVVFFKHTEKPSTYASSSRDISMKKSTSDIINSPESTASKSKSQRKPTNETELKLEKTPEECKKSPEDTNEMLEVQHITVENDVKFADDVENSTEKEKGNILKDVESLEEADKKAKDDFVTATEHILSSSSDLSQVVNSFENVQPIYSSETLNFRSNDENTPSPKNENNEVKDQQSGKKNGDKKIEASTKSDKTNESEKKDAYWETQRDRKKSSVLTDADLTRKSSEDPYPIEIPLKKKVSKNTRKKLWHELQKRKPLISASVYAHIQRFAKPPFQTWGCHNCGYRKSIRSLK